MLGRISWKRILDGTSKVFLELKNSASGSQSATCLTWFYDSFYARLFDVNPSARPLFKTNLQSQGRVLVGVITTALNQLKDPESFNKMLVNLAHVHSKRGVRGLQYGIVGDVLFWTLRKCLGSEYDALTAVAWTKIYSYMLYVIVPVAAADEIQDVRMNLHSPISEKTGPIIGSATNSKTPPTIDQVYTFMDDDVVRDEY